MLLLFLIFQCHFDINLALQKVPKPILSVFKGSQSNCETILTFKRLLSVILKLIYQF